MKLESSLVNRIERILMISSAVDEAMGKVLDAALAHFECEVGTIHRLDEPSGELALVAQRGVPDSMLDRVQSIPIGKGMAGLAAERREPVQICNLQTDESGQAKPAARETGMEGSIAIPMMTGDRLMGVMGVAKPSEYEFNEDERDLLVKIGAVVARFLEEEGEAQER